MYFVAIILSVTIGLVVGDDEPNTSYYYPAASNGLNHGASLRSPLNSIDEDPISILARNIPGDGVPGEDYPILSHVPDTGFDCKKQSFSGYFADVDEQALCQVFHICQDDGAIDSFLCPNGSLFNQQYFVCDWWFNVDCSESEQYFRLNEDIGVVPEESQVRGRFDSPGLSYSAPNTARSDHHIGNFLNERTESQNKKQEVVIQNGKVSLDSRVDVPKQIDSTLTRGYQAFQRRDSSVNNLYQAAQLRTPEQREDITISQSYQSPQLRESSPNKLYIAPKQREDIAISQSYQSPQLRELSPNQLYQTSEQKEVRTLSQSYQSPQLRESSPNQLYQTPELKEVRTLSQSYQSPQLRESRKV